jgi:hypothetical protein
MPSSWCLDGGSIDDEEGCSMLPTVSEWAAAQPSLVCTSASMSFAITKQALSDIGINSNVDESIAALELLSWGAMV